MSMAKGTPASSQIIFLEQMVEKQADRIAELEAALEPFADKAFVLTDLPDNWMANVKVSYFRAAHKVLGEKK